MRLLFVSSFKMTLSKEVDEVLNSLNQPITKRTVIWDKESFDLKECEPVIPETLTASEIHVHSTKDLWDTDSVCYWKETVLFFCTYYISLIWKKRILIFSSRIDVTTSI